MAKKLLCFLLLLVAVFGQLAIVVAATQTFQQMRAADLELNHLQDLGRQREILYMRDLARLRLEASQWFKLKECPANEQVNQLTAWFEDDFAELSKIVGSSDGANQYLSNIAQHWQSVHANLQAFLSAKRANDQLSSRRHYTAMQHYAALLQQDITSKAAGIKDPNSSPEALQKRQSQLGKQFAILLFISLLFYMQLVLGLAAYLKWGPPEQLSFLYRGTSLLWKFILLTGTPICFELIFLSLLSVLFYHSSDSVAQILRDRSLDHIHNELYGQVEVLVNARADDPRLKETMHGEIAELRRILADRPQQLYGLDVIESSIEKIASLKRDLNARERASDKAGASLYRALISPLFEHTIIYVYYGKPDIGRQAALKTKLQVASEQIETEKQLEWVIMLGIIFSIALTVMLVRFFNDAAGKRLATIAENIDRFADKEPLLPEVGGSDEIAALDRFFHKTAAEVDEMLKRERAVIESSCDIICSIDSSNRFAFVNPAVQDIWGYQTNEITGLAVTDFVSIEDCIDTTAAFDTLRESHVPATFENRIKKADGSLADMQWACQWSESEKLIFCILQDISTRKQMERLKQEFVAIVSHDLRTPITASSVFLEIVSAGIYGQLTPEGQLELEKTAEDLQSLSDLVIDLLDIERLNSGKLDLELQPMRLSKIVSGAYEKVESYAVRNNVLFDIQQAQGDPPVMLDEHRTEQVAINLFAYAIKLSQRRSYVRISQECMEGQVKVTVALDAASITTAITEVIFEPYRVNELPTAADCGGRNLGLPLCKAIINKLGGRIGVEQFGGIGLSFWFQLPVARSSGQAVAVSDASIAVMDKAAGA